MSPRPTSRTYNREEKSSPWFKPWQDRIFRRNSFRDWEVPAVIQALAPDASLRYLSIGGLDCSATFAVGRVAEVHTIDTNARVLDWPEEYGTSWPPNVYPQVIEQKGEIPYPDAFFDAVFSVSALEHSRGSQDMDTARQVGRVLRPGGLFVLTVEFGPFVNYDPVCVGGRIYDEKAIEQRIVEPSLCTWAGERHFVMPTLEDDRRNGHPAAVSPFWPALIVLRRTCGS